MWCRREYSETHAIAKELLEGGYQERSSTQSVAAMTKPSKENCALS